MPDNPYDEEPEDSPVAPVPPAADPYADAVSSYLSGQAGAHLATPIAPAQAQRAIKDAPVTGVAPLAAANDPGMPKLAAARTAQAHVDSNPAVSFWAATDPVKTAATREDFGPLGNVANQFGKDWLGYFQKWGQSLSETAQQSSDKQQEFLKNPTFGGFFDALLAQQKAKMEFEGSIAAAGTAVTSVGGAAAALAFPTVHAGGAAAARAAYPEDPKKQETLAKDIDDAFNLSMLGLRPGAGSFGAKPAPDVGPVRGEPVSPHQGPDSRFSTNADGHVADVAGNPVEFGTQKDAANWILRTGHAQSPDQIFEVANGSQPGSYVVRERGRQTQLALPEAGADAAVDKARGVVADLDAGSFAQVEKAVAETATHQQSPELMKEFLQQQVGDRQVYVPADRLVEEFKGDLSALPPEVSNAVEVAQAHGGDVAIPMADYLSATAGKPQADALRPDLRLREDGVSVNEAEELQQEPKGVAPAEEEAAPKVVDPMQVAAQRAAKAQYLHQAFESADSIGMTESQFATYSKKVERIQGQTYEKMLADEQKRVARDEETRNGDRYKAEYNDVARPAAEAELAGRRDLVARAALQYGESPLGAPLAKSYKISRKKLAEDLGDAQLPYNLPGSMFAKTGMDPEAAAHEFGYDSADELFKELRRLEIDQAFRRSPNARAHFKSLVDEEATRKTEAALGIRKGVPDFQEMAREAIARPEVEDLLTTELRALGAKAGLPMNKGEIRAEALRLYDQLTVKDATNIREFERAVGRGGRKAELAILAGKFPDAFKAKQQQLVAQIMLQESHGLRTQYVKTDARFKKYGKSPTISGVAQAYTNYVHAALATMDYPVSRNEAELLDALGGKTLSSFADEKANEGYELVHSEFPATPLSAMRLPDFRAARDTVASLIHNGRLEESVEVAGRREELEGILAEVSANAAALGNKLTPNRQEKRTLSGKAGGIARAINSPNIRGEQLLDEMDRNDPLGPLNRAVTQPLQTAKGVENDMLTSMTAELKAFGESQPKGWLASAKRVVDVPELLWEGDRRVLTKGHVIGMALNWGNAGNRAALLQGYGWEQAAVEAVLDRYMAKADWDFAQKIWDMHEGLWPKIVETYRNLSGIAPTKVEAQAVQTPFGEYKGGYYPIVKDRLRSLDRVGQTSLKSLFGDEYQSALPGNPYTKSRTGNVAPLSLSFENIPALLGQHIHDIAFRPALLQAGRVLLHPKVTRAIQDNFGVEYKNQLRPWLEYTARERVTSEPSSEFSLANGIRMARHNINIVGLGYRLSSAMKHFGVALSNSLGEVGVPDFMGALRDMYVSPGQADYWQSYALDNSAELRHRSINLDRDMREQIQALNEKQGLVYDFQKMAFHMIAASDQFSATPTWLAGYRRAIREGYSPEDAKAIGDKRVRQAHGSSAPVDLPAILRGGHDALGELGRTTMNFLSFQNHAYNRAWRIKNELSRAAQAAGDNDWEGAKRDFSKAMGKTLFYMVVPVFWLTGVVKAVQKRHPLGVGDWVDGVAHTSFGALPMVSTILDMFERGEAESPFAGAIKDTHATGKNVVAAAKGDTRHVAGRWLQQALNTIGYWTGLPTGQVGTSGQYVWNFATGAERPKDPLDFAAGLAFGPKPKEKK